MVATVQNAPQRNAPPPTFNMVAQDYVAAVGAVAYDGGLRNPNPLQLIPDGYLNRLHFVVTLNGTYGVAAPTAVDPLAQFSGPVDHVELVGTQNRGLFNLTGEFMGIFTFLDRWYRQPGVNASSLVSGPGFNGVANPTTAPWADTWYFDLSLGLRVDEIPAPIGLYPVGFTGPAPRINIYWRPTNATAANPGTGVYVPGGTSTGPNPTGSADVSQYGFAPVAVDGAQPPGNFVRTFREGSVSINGNQWYELDLTQGAFVNRLVIFTVANGAMVPVTNITNIEYDFGFGMRRKTWNTLQLQNMLTSSWGTNLPNWLVPLDFITPTHSMRDWINTTAVTKPRVMVQLGGLTFGGAQNQIRFGVEEIFPYATAVANSIR